MILDQTTIEQTYGESFGAKLVIGFTNVYYTLWVVTYYAHVENVRYIQNLSMDFGAAQSKARDILVNDSRYGDTFEIDLELHGKRNCNVLNYKSTSFAGIE